MLVVGLATALVWMSGPSAAKGADGQHLDGSWNVTGAVTRQVGTIHALLTFTRDGSVIETPVAPGVSAGHGGWIRTGNREFAITVLYLRIDAQGQFIGTSKVRARFRLNETLDQAGGEYQTDVFDQAGQLVTSFEGTAQAVRIAVEPL